MISIDKLGITQHDARRENILSYYENPDNIDEDDCICNFHIFPFLQSFQIFKPNLHKSRNIFDSTGTPFPLSRVNLSPSINSDKKSKLKTNEFTQKRKPERKGNKSLLCFAIIVFFIITAIVISLMINISMVKDILPSKLQILSTKVHKKTQNLGRDLNTNEQGNNLGNVMNMKLGKLRKRPCYLPFSWIFSNKCKNISRKKPLYDCKALTDLMIE